MTTARKPRKPTKKQSRTPEHRGPKARQLAKLCRIPLAAVTGNEIPEGLHMLWRSFTRDERWNVWNGVLVNFIIRKLRAERVWQP